MSLELIATQNIPLIWPVVEQRVVSAIERNGFVEYDSEYVRSVLVQGNAQLWIGGEGEIMAFTRIVSFGETLRLVVDFIEGSNPEKYTEHMECIERWAVQHGATQAEAELRPGLEKLARKQGWGKKRVQMYKHLTQRMH